MLTNTFTTPPNGYGPIPFWFWNDDLQEDELLRQLHAFHQAGFAGVLPHARTGLSRRIGYLSETYFGLMKRIVAEAARLDMKIILYDEGSYPSGTAKGAVVAENPAFASQAIGVWDRIIEGPYNGFWRPNTGRALLDQHVCTILGQLTQDKIIDPASLHILSPLKNNIFHLDLSPGKWQIMSVWNTASGAHIRGVFPEEESGHATAPAAADILNPAAVDCFIRLTHDAYYHHLKEYFGSTIIAFFTDEPSIFGKGAQRPRQARPFTPGFIEWLSQHLGYDVQPWLPALWHDYGPQTESFRQQYNQAVQTRLHEVFYSKLSSWCAAHNIALTGHPIGSNELSALRYFQLPGQDMVWRWVEPASPSALEGEHSVAPKAATSAARINGSKRVLTEVCGAYGWQLTLDEVKWLFDWHLVRGNNLIMPHAVFYSIRERRAWESEPDIGIHNVWWPHFHHLAHYCSRLSWLLSEGKDQTNIAILGDGNALPWQGAKGLFQQQIDFLYLDCQALEEAQVTDQGLKAGTQLYHVIIIEGISLVNTRAQQILEQFVAAGGHLIHYQEGLDLAAAIDQYLPRTVHLQPANPDLRFTHYCKDGLDYMLLVNEGEDSIQGKLSINRIGAVEGWDAFTGQQVELAMTATDQHIICSLELDRRQSLVLVINTQLPFQAHQLLPQPTQQSVPVDAHWTVSDISGKVIEVPAPADWAQCPDFELFSGTLRYNTTLNIPHNTTHAWLDLGHVGMLAELYFDNQSLGAKLWSPYCFSLGKQPGGDHQIEIHITNSMANAYEGIQSPAGLIGPVNLIYCT